MKKYTHKSGKYSAHQDMYKQRYEIIQLVGYGTDIDRIIGDWPKDVIEGSNDWVEMVEMPVGNYYSFDQAGQAFCNYINDLRVLGKHLPFKEKENAYERFISYLKDQKNKK